MTASAKRVLLVDDEEKLLQFIARRMQMLGFVPLTATSGLSAIDIATKHPIDLAIVDLQMPDMNGLVTITKLKEIRPRLKTILLTGHGNEKVKQATESLNTLYFEKDEMGDFWQFIKNLDTGGNVVVIRPGSAPTGQDGPSIDEIKIQSPQPYAGDSRTRPPTARQNGRFGHFTQPRIVGEAPAMQELRKTIGRLAPLDCTVMLSGESGTGKELAARVIHARSGRRLQRFLAIDCGDLDNAQFVHQLIGYGKNDLCTAIQSQQGIFGADRVGTLFFDLVEKMPMTMQAQLLKTIDTIDRSRAAAEPGGTADIRILVTTETDLAQRVESGRFDGELYDRLIFFNLLIPPLRDRKDDIPPLCSYFLRRFSEDFDKAVDTIAQEVIDTFFSYDFPGNVRELAHLIERAVILADSNSIARNHLPGRFLKAVSSAEAPDPENLLTLAELENHYIMQVLEAAHGNKSRTAEILGISRAALWRKLKRLKAEQSGP